ncbi:pyridoxamine 5'-phosphate oxidase family protein [Puia sp. P3]|uniref:pyridoxamine 5'-phosphate oxidase family protein n=1 Tax=Puia sp. P3 TaxID=3423952 RepID=UPI003D67F963
MAETDKLLKKEVVGRLACGEGSNIYVVPISYVYDGEYIYCHTHEGLKVEIMRRQPKVCFEVDHLRDMANWQSAVVFGTFEELADPAPRSHALKSSTNASSRCLPAKRPTSRPTGHFLPKNSTG